jgi:hypothetical protein
VTPVAGTRMIVLPGGGYAEHAPHEAEPVAEWLGADGAPDQTVQFAVLGYAITSMETQTYRPARVILAASKVPHAVDSRAGVSGEVIQARMMPKTSRKKSSIGWPFLTTRERVSAPSQALTMNRPS